MVFICWIRGFLSTKEQRMALPKHRLKLNEWIEEVEQPDSKTVPSYHLQRTVRNKKEDDN